MNGSENRNERGMRDEDRTMGHREQRERNAGNGPLHVAEVGLRGTALLVDLQLEAARTLWRTQARSATLFGAPDFSHVFQVGDDRARRLFLDATEQAIGILRNGTDTLFAVQQELAQVTERQAIEFAEDLREQIERLGRQTERGLKEIRCLTAEEAQALDARRGLQSNREPGTDDERAMDERGRGDETREAAGERAQSRSDDARDQRPATAEARQARERSRAKA